jgi:hypothetical protein
MLRIKCVVGAAAVLFTAFNLGRAADDETYDLRGPAPEVGQVMTHKETLKIKDADATVKVAGQKIDLKLDIVVTDEEVIKILAVKGRDVIKSQARIIKQRVDTTANVGGKKTSQTEPTELEKETIISVWDGKNWKHSLVDTKPTDKQKKELDNRNGLENDDELYPEEKVKVGYTWTVDRSEALGKILGSPFADVKGKVNRKFTKIDEVDNEKVAVIESTAKLTAKMKEDGEPTTDAELEMKITTWRSIKTGTTVKEKFDGKIKLAGTVKMDDMNVEMTLSGAITSESTTKLQAK